PAGWRDPGEPDERVAAGVGRHWRWNAERRQLPAARQSDRGCRTERADERHRDGHRQLLRVGLRPGQSRRVGQLHRRRSAFLMARGLSFAVACALLLVGCNGNSTQRTVTTASQTRTTDTFSGTVQVGGSNFHSFPVAQTGTTDVTLTAASPPANVAMGLAVGTPGDGNCAPLAGAAQNVVAGPTPQI